MLDGSSRIEQAYESYQFARKQKEAASARISSRVARLAKMPPPIRFVISWGQAIGLFEYEHPKAEMFACYSADSLMLTSSRVISNELATTPGTYPLSSVWYHPDSILSSRRKNPWVAHFGLVKEDDYFESNLGAPQFLAKKTSGDPEIEIRESAQPILYLPRGFRMTVCSNPDVSCEDDNYCSGYEVPVRGLRSVATLLPPPKL